MTVSLARQFNPLLLISKFFGSLELFILSKQHHQGHYIETGAMNLLVMLKQLVITLCISFLGLL
jgi:hypothetical protein